MTRAIDTPMTLPTLPADRALVEPEGSVSAAAPNMAPYRTGPAVTQTPSAQAYARHTQTRQFAAPVDTLVQQLLRIDDPSRPEPPIELFYDSIADKFDEIMNHYDMRRRVTTVFDVFLRDHDLTGRRLLDAGCGTGWFSLRASQRGANVTALDIGPRLLQQVRRKCDARTVCGNVLDLQFDSDSFDVVVSSECIEHTARPRDAVRELIRVCRPGGLIAITSNNHFWFWLCALANRLKLRPYEGIENWPRWADLRSWVKRENVQVIDHRGIHAFPFQVAMLHPLLKFLDRFGRRLGPVCVNQAILAIKKC